MPRYYPGTPQLNQLALAIVGATNASPIVIQTSTPHFYSTGDRVVVGGVGGNTAANCPISTPWPVDVVDATHFSLRGSTGNGAYTSGGTVYNLGLTPPLTIALDGEGFGMTSFDPAFNGIGDREQTLAQALLTGYAPIALYQQGTNDDTWATWATASASGGWGALLNGVTHVGDLLRFDLNPPAPLVNHGDLLAIACELGDVQSATHPTAFQLAVMASSQLSNNLTGTIGGAKLIPAGGEAALTWNAIYKVFASDKLASVTAWDGTKATFTGLSGMSAQSVGDQITIYGAASAGNNQAFLVTDYVNAGSVKGVPLGGLVPVAGDANNGAIHWAMQNMKFSVQIQNMQVGSAGTYTLTGHRQMTVLHLRRPQMVLV